MAQSLEQILNVSAADGPFGKGDSVLEQTLRDFIQLQSTLLAVGTKVVGVRTVPWLTFKWFTGVEGTFTFPIDDNAVVEPTKELTQNYTATLSKGQGRCTFLDSVRLRGESFETLDRQQLAIVTNLDLIFTNARVSGDEGVALVLPTLCRSTMLNTQLFGNVILSLQEHLSNIADITVHYSRDAATSGTATALDQHGIMLIPGAQTAEFFQYNGPGFQETELTRVPGVGFDWLLTSYMGSVIHEHQDGASSGTNNRIVKLTDIIA